MPPAPKGAWLVHGATTNSQTTDDTIVRRRILERYPIGGPEGDLPQFLEAQGFKVRRVTNVGVTGDQVYGEARLRWGNPIEARVVRVMWRATKDGALIEVETLIRPAGLVGELTQF